MSNFIIGHMKCEEAVSLLGGNAVDHVITDPPYDKRTHARARSLKGGGSDIAINFAPLETFTFAGDMVMCARRWVLAFCALEQLGAYQAAAGDDWVRAGVWHRTDGTPQISGDRPAQGAEGIAIMHGQTHKKRWNNGGNRGHWTCGIERNERLHPTQKPLRLMMELVEQFTDPGDVILDPFCGSGTTGVACARLGRRFIGVDADERYAAMALERLTAAAEYTTVAAARVGQVAMFGGAT